MAQKICKRKNQEIDFPKDCQGCGFLTESGETPDCSYGESEGKKTAKKGCCHC
ncbi:MAG: hypothetical protein KJ821_08090 [Actinobacteria bacterium]|nr:hypothetical protein [Actinomycetota bacterium]